MNSLYLKIPAMIFLLVLASPCFSQDDDPNSESNLKRLGSPKAAVREAEKKKLIEAIPDPGAKALLALFDDGNTQFKLEAIDVFQAYGANSVFSYGPLMDAACDPNPKVSAKARKVLAEKGIAQPPCLDGPTPTPTAKPGKLPKVVLELSFASLDGTQMRLSFPGLGEKKFTMDVSYSPDTIESVVLYPKTIIPVKSQEGLIRYEMDLDQEKAPFLIVKPNSKATHRPQASGPVRSYVQVTINPIPGGPVAVDSSARLEFESYPWQWVGPGQRLFKKIVDDFETSFTPRKDFNDIYAWPPNFQTVWLGPQKEALMVVTLMPYKTQSGNPLSVYRLKGEGVEKIAIDETEYRTNAEVLPVNGENALVIHGTQGFIYFLRGGKLRKVFEYEDYGCLYQDGCGFETHLKNEGGKLYLYRQESLRMHPRAEDLQKEARWRRGEVVWDPKTEQFHAEPFQLVNP